MSLAWLWAPPPALISLKIWLISLGVLAILLSRKKIFPFSCTRKLLTVLLTRWFSYSLLALCLVLPSAIYLKRNGLPLPRMHDEFSYLLAEATYAQGRLTNPAPPEAEAFATFHVLVRPTYASKYQPGLGYVMALGLLTVGTATAGLWFVFAVSAFVLYELLRAWTTRLAALCITLHYVLNESVVKQWVWMYWGGALPSLGAFLGVLDYVTDRLWWKVS